MGMCSEQGHRTSAQKTIGSKPWKFYALVGDWEVVINHSRELYCLVFCSWSSSVSALRTPTLQCKGFMRLAALDVQVLEKLYPGRPIVNDLYEVCNMSLAALRRQRAQA